MHVFSLGRKEIQGILVLLVLDEEIHLKTHEHGLVLWVLKLWLLFGLFHSTFSFLKSICSKQAYNLINAHIVPLSLCKGLILFQLGLDSFGESLVVKRPNDIFKGGLVKGIDLVKSINVHLNENVVLNVLREVEPTVLFRFIDMVFHTSITLPHLVEKMHFLNFESNEILFQSRTIVLLCLCVSLS